MIFAVLFSQLYAGEILFPVNSDIQLSYDLSSTSFELNDTLVIDWTLTNDSDDILNNLYWNENMPSGFNLISYSIRLNGNQISSYHIGGFSDHIYSGYNTYRWVIDEPSSEDSYNHKLNPGDEVELLYRIAFQSEGTFDLPFHTLCFDNGDQGSYTVGDPVEITVGDGGDYGNISGIITDTSSHPITNAMVTLIGTGATSTSGLEGQYYFGDVLPGTYSISISHPSYRDTTVSNIIVTANQTTTRNIVLHLRELLYLPGDINGDNTVIGSDITYAVTYFRGIGPPPPDSVWLEAEGRWLYAAADANGSCEFIGSDVTYLVAYFRMIHDQILYCPESSPFQ
jgi:hypothetical protein